VRSCDVSQQALFAQQLGWHAVGLDAFDRMQGDAGNRTVAAQSASPTAIDTVILLNIRLLHNTISAAGRIEQRVRRAGIIS